MAADTVFFGCVVSDCFFTRKIMFHFLVAGSTSFRKKLKVVALLLMYVMTGITGQVSRFPETLARQHQLVLIAVNIQAGGIYSPEFGNIKPVDIIAWFEIKQGLLNVPESGMT